MKAGSTRRGIIPQHFGRRDALTLGLLCAAAYAGNLAAVPLFTGVDLLFGGVAVMFTVLRRSLAEAILVAGVGSLHTLVLWGHPYALIIFVAEACWVHLLYARWKREITLHDAAFWVIVGVPLVWIFYRLVMGMDPIGAGLIALKQPVNGLLYTAIASILHHLMLLRESRIPLHRRRLRFADVLAPVLLVFMLLPMLAIVSLYTRVEREQALTRTANELHAAVRYLNPYETARSGLQGAVEQWRDRLRPLAVEDVAIALVRADGTSVAESPEGWLSTRPGASELALGLVKRHADTKAVMTRERGAYLVHSVTDPQGPGASDFDLILGVQAAPYVDQLRSLQLAALGFAALIAAGGVAGSSVVARRTGRLLDPIIARLRAVPANIHEERHSGWVQSPIKELAALTEGIADMEEQLARQVHALAENEQRFRAIASNLPGGVYQRRMEPDGHIRFSYLSPYYEQVFGIDTDRARYEPEIIMELIHPEDRADYHAALGRSARSLTALDFAFRLQDANGEIRWIRSLGQPRREKDGAIVWDGIAIDETARKKAEAELEFLARYDSLTGLLNREEILRQLSVLLREQVEHAPVSVLYVDLDRIKPINDTMGHAAGDEVIRAAAQRIQSAVRDIDHVGRYGGDEFVILAAGSRDDTAAGIIATRVLQKLRGTLQVDERDIELSATIGILARPDRLDDPAECLRKADVALYQGKRENRGTWYFYSPDLDADQRWRINLLDDLRDALESPDDQLFLEYHPKVKLATGYVTGVEALVRWQHPTEGRIPPDWFVPLAEESELIDVLGDWVLRRACADLSAWRSLDPDAAPCHVSVNISGRQLKGETLWDSVWNALSDNGLGPETLELEITENVFYSARAQTLERLSNAGVCLAIDDFGKGYSSLFVLRDSPARVVKIDRSFVSGTQTSEADRAIVEHTIRLAHELGRYVVAEGVETAEQLDMLRRMECDMAQGFYLARPMSAEKIPEIWRHRW